MRGQLIHYVELLFAGNPGTEEIKQEILQNTLDRYDDLIAQGKTAEAAYRLAISGIGDIHEILGQELTRAVAGNPGADVQTEEEAVRDKKTRAIAIAMYILCPIPLFILSELGYDTLGLCLTLGLVAAATYTLILANKTVPDSDTFEKAVPLNPLAEKKKRIGSVIGTAALVIFLVLSFLTGAWFTTWLIFPIAACVRGLVNAILDLKEVTKNEN